jgi:hypothetical protein
MFESPVWQELGALTKRGKTLGVRSFHMLIIFVEFCKLFLMEGETCLQKGIIIYQGENPFTKGEIHLLVPCSFDPA